MAQFWGNLQYAQEQEFFRQTALVSKKEKEKVLMEGELDILFSVFVLISSLNNF